jgi:hypothetical protein
MGIVLNCIQDDPNVRDHFRNGIAWHLIIDACVERSYEDAESEIRDDGVVALVDMIVDSDHEPDWSEISEFALHNASGWRDIIKQVAIATVNNRNYSDINEDIATLQAAADAIEAEGYELKSIGSCPIAHIPHVCEGGWSLTNGTEAVLHIWDPVDGVPDKRYYLAVPIEGGDVWFELDQEPEEDDEETET